jgi:hypothetical protein
MSAMGPCLERRLSAILGGTREWSATHDNTMRQVAGTGKADINARPCAKGRNVA